MFFSYFALVIYLGVQLQLISAGCIPGHGSLSFSPDIHYTVLNTRAIATKSALSTSTGFAYGFSPAGEPGAADAAINYVPAIGAGPQKIQYQIYIKNKLPRSVETQVTWQFSADSAPIMLWTITSEAGFNGMICVIVNSVYASSYVTTIQME